MKPIFVLAFAVLAASNTFGFYVQNPVHGSGCGCGGDIVNIPLDQLPVAGQQQQQPNVDDGTRYKFDFGIQQPRADAPQPQLNSYGYQVQEPTEPQVDDTKYKYDYTLQQPIEGGNVAEPQQPALNAKVDRVVRDKPVCTCAAGNPCTCGYSAPINTNNAYVLPVRYNNGGDYVVYELPQDEQSRYLHRVARQVPAAPVVPVAPVAPVDAGQTPSTIDAAAIADRIQKVAAAFRERASRFIPSDSGSEQRVGSILGSRLAAFDSTLGSTNTADQSGSRVAAFRERFSTLAEPIVGVIRESFATAARSKRDTMDAERRTNEPTMPVLRVKEYNPSNEQTHYSKYMNRNMGRVALQTPEHHAKDIKEMEKCSHCHSCGTKLTTSMCSHCGQYQPQYIQYIEGRQVPFYPGAVQENQEQTTLSGVEATRFIFDRYGHKYLENNGKLRLVRNQPDYAGLASILNDKENEKVMKQINQNPGRLVEQPVDMVTDLSQLVRDLARYPRKAAASDATPRSMYQVVPMQYEGKDGKLVVKIYDSKNTETGVATTQTTQTTNEMEKAQPDVKKYVKNNKEYEILTFNDYKGPEDGDDDIRRVLEHLHGKQQW